MIQRKREQLNRQLQNYKAKHNQLSQESNTPTTSRWTKNQIQENCPNKKLNHKICPNQSLICLQLRWRQSKIRHSFIQQEAWPEVGPEVYQKPWHPVQRQ